MIWCAAATICGAPGPRRGIGSPSSCCATGTSTATGRAGRCATGRGSPPSAWPIRSRTRRLSTCSGTSRRSTRRSPRSTGSSSGSRAASRGREPVAWLCSFRGIATRTALGLLAEIGDFRRFASPRELMSYLGLTPTEYSSGAQQHRGHITKAGNTHARRLLIEAAWNYQHRPRQSARAARLAERGPARDHRPRLAGADPTVPPPPRADRQRETLDRRDDRGRARARRVHLGRDGPSPAPRTTTRRGRRCLNPPRRTPAGVGRSARPT